MAEAKRVVVNPKRTHRLWNDERLHRPTETRKRLAWASARCGAARQRSQASTVATPPTTMMPPPLPSESRFRLTSGCALMWATLAAPGMEYTVGSAPSK